MTLDAVDLETRALLERYGFDDGLFESLRERVASGKLSVESNFLRGSIEPPAAGDVVRPPAPGEPGHAEARAAGIDALRRGELAQLVLAGRMATRFGGVVKAVLPAVDGKSFLEAKLSQTTALEWVAWPGGGGRWRSWSAADTAAASGFRLTRPRGIHHLAPSGRVS